MYKNILFAADLLSEDDDPVAKRALALVKTQEASLSIVHVVEFMTSYGIPPAPINIATWQQELETLAKIKLNALGNKLGVPENKQFLMVGSAKELILQTAEKIGADLIIIGSHSRHGLSYLFFGSTATGVLHHAKCDILAVKV